MQSTWKLAWAFLRHNKSQTMALFVGILLAAALFTGVGSLFASGQEAAKENARAEYGNWHYTLRADLPWFEKFLEESTGEGYTLDSYGVETVRKEISAPFTIQYVSADDGYLAQMGRTLAEGRMPAQDDEIAMDVSTLRNLGAAQTLGETLTLDGETFTLTGIVAEMPEKLSEQMGDFMQAFVSPTLDYGQNGRFVYLTFDESRPVQGQMAAFAQRYGIRGDMVARNNGLAGFVGAGGERMTMGEIVKALKDPSLGIPYVWGSLNENQRMTEGTVLLSLALFAAFIIYSIFQVSVLRRMQHYSVMQTLGLTTGGIFRLLLIELLTVFVVGYAAGSALGNGVAAFVYARLGRIFVVRDTALHSGIDVTENAEALSVTQFTEIGAFHVDWALILGGALFLAILLVVVSGLLVRSMQRLSLRQMLSQEGGCPRSQRIMSLRHVSLTGVLTKRFMFARKRTFVGILLSLAMGSVIFLSASYVITNTKSNNDLLFAADDGLGSDIQLTEERGLLSQTIPEETVRALRVTEGISAVQPVGYMLGEVSLENGAFKWPSYYAETADEPGFEPDPEVMTRYGGKIVQTGEEDYRLKVNIYGYDDAMLSELSPYLLEGTIDPEAMRENDTVIVKPLIDGQGNHDGIDLALGDALTLKTPRDAKAEDDVLHFDSAPENYAGTNVGVSAMVSRPLGKVKTTIGDDGQSTVDIIMTQAQLEKYFGTSGYQTVSVRLTEDADAAAVAGAVRRLTADIPGCKVQDYTTQIAAQNLYLTQQMLFFYGIALVLLVASLLHIANSMQYLVAARRHEFAILRAMGITDSGFLRMLAKEGLRYGLYASLAVAVVYSFVQRVLYHFLQHVYLYLHPSASLGGGWFLGVCAVNILLCAAVLCLAGRGALKRSMLE